MSGQWAIVLPIDKAMHAAGLREWPGLRVCVCEDELWLAGEEMSDTLRLELLKLPGARRFVVAEDGAVTPEAARVPIGKLPTATWIPLSRWISPAGQVAAMAGMTGKKSHLRLVRTGGESSANILITTLAHWTAYASTAPLVRLRCLHFAASADGRVLVRGTPLPPLPGRRYVERDGIAIPAGFALEPALDAAAMRRVLGTTATDLALFDEDGSWEKIDAGNFVAAGRAAVRATAEVLDRFVSSG